MPNAIDSAYVSIYPVTEGFGKAVHGAMGDAGTTGGRAFGESMERSFSAKTVALGNIMSSLAMKGAALVESSLGGAIKRVDTMNAFPRVMASLGYSAEDASKSIEKMSDRLSGLPTSLDDMTNTVQMLAPITGSLDSATDVALALNDALIASGKSTADQSRAMQQYSQMLAAGKVDMQSWKTLQEVMPGQLDQLAKALIGPKAKAKDLYEAMQKGTVTFDDFNDALLRLDKEGVNGFESFEAQARAATGGIQTAFETMKTAVVRGLAGLIESIGIENIVDFINNVKDVINDVFSSLKPLFQFLSNAIRAIADWISSNLVVDHLEVVIPLLYGLAAAIVAVQLGLSPILAVVAGIAVAISALWTKCEPFKEWLTNVWEKVKGFFESIPEFLEQLPYKIAAFFKGIVNKVKDFIKRVGDWFGQIPYKIAEIIQKIVDWFKSLPGRVLEAIQNGFQRVVDFFKSLPARILGGVADLAHTLYNKGVELIEGFKQGIKDALKRLGDWLSNHFAINGVVVMPGGISSNETLPIDIQMNLMGMARGGIVTRATHILAGEGGPEAIIPLNNPHLKPFLENSGDTYNMYIDGARINDDEAMRRATYNYLMTMKRYATMQGA